MPETRTLRGWVEYLDDPKRELTLSEFMAVMLMNGREYGRLALESAHTTAQAVEHVEGMLGAIDNLLDRATPGYAGSATVRAALDATRDERRRLASLVDLAVTLPRPANGVGSDP